MLFSNIQAAEVPFVTRSCLAVVLWHVGCFSASLCDMADLCFPCLPSLLLFACHWPFLMCVWIYKVHLLHFSSSLLQSYLFSGPCLFLFALDWLKASVCIPKQLRDAAANKEDYCLSLKKDIHLWRCFPEWFATHLSYLFSWRRPFILHPRGEWVSATKGCRVSRALEKPGAKSIAH